MTCTRLFCTLAVAALAAPTFAAEYRIPTNAGTGADAEVRESNPTQNRGSSTELASRVIDRFTPATFDNADRRSVMYLQFDLTTLGSQPYSGGAQVDLTYRNNNLNISRVSDQDTLDPDLGAVKLNYYGIAGASFDETTINYINAPGITLDGDVGTNDLSPADLLGFAELPAIGTQNHLPIGGKLSFNSAALDAFIAGEIASNPSGVAVIAVTLEHDGGVQDTGDPNQEKFGDYPINWSNFNYLFNPKEQVTLNDDGSYDADSTDMLPGAGGPFSRFDNTFGGFSPALIVQVPEPATGLLGAMALAALGLRRRV